MWINFDCHKSSFLIRGINIFFGDFLETFLRLFIFEKNGTTRRMMRRQIRQSRNLEIIIIFRKTGSFERLNFTIRAEITTDRENLVLRSNNVVLGVDYTRAYQFIFGQVGPRFPLNFVIIAWV